MRILIDASIVKPSLGGIATYSVALASALGDRCDVRILTSCPERFPAELQDRICRTPTLSRNFAARQIWRDLTLERLARRSSADVVLITCPEHGWRRLPVPSVIVLHDIGPVTNPEFFSRLRRLRFRALLPGALRRATMVATVSEWAAISTRDWLGPGKADLVVVGGGVSETWFEHDEESSLTASRNQNGEYIVYLGTTQRHKNLAVLVEAMALLPDVELRMAGPGTEAYDRASTNIRGLGWIPRDELVELVRSASLMVNPSLQEGFGLPAIEALATGTPTVLSDIPAFREVAGDAAEYVSAPEEPRAWVDAISHLLSDAAKRSSMRERGPSQAKRWTWDAVATEVIEVCERLVSAGQQSRP